MIRIGIVGSDNSHAIAYSKLANIDQVVGERARVTTIWGADTDRTSEVAAKGNIPEIATSLHKLVDQVDAAIVVDRHGDLHAEHALPLLLEGKPVFVDKPFAIDLADCRRMLNAAKQARAAITSFSSLSIAPDTKAMKSQALGTVRLGQFAGPCDFGSEYGGPFFYATHLIELAITLLGERVSGLQASRAGNTVVVNAIWDNDAIGTLGYFKDAQYHFHASLFGTDGMVNGEIRVDDAGYAEALSVAVDMFETGKNPLSNRHLLLPIVMTEAIVRSLDRDGEWVDVADRLDQELSALG
ncbi:MAG TPA: Gfo/Idh/MocA family oxidoreductase [Thermomicrobiales bacterium]|nr:Gfo/Idh/MocA family oxidoreductase [Thermomicrobiales bacterium]